ncbi:DUF2442 domain-containing protein [Francisella sp. TX07-6608]|uniref:DUF2442 domain-containing protein n=1 Tax=Francisella sp. TX07-6608 TaxID=573568 RepID=UPI0008F9D42D|nr:DUF2442 domain-containing protein [Francisella sp. TX07-6608]OIN82916.1 hypothetical protein KX00_2019 [Francisella sp. TX07-6608]
MYWDIKKVNYKQHLKLEVEFVDGLKGDVCFAIDNLRGVFEPLKNTAEFKKFFIGNGHTIVWDCGVDVAPDRLHKDIKNKGVCIL